MNIPKTNLVKSKSSNSAITTKSASEKSDKKSRSHVEIMAPAKKRGVYVQKQPTKLPINATVDNVSKQTKPIPRSRKKRFLASVLTILSKSTAGTQFPDADDPKNNDKTKLKCKKKKYNENDITEDTTIKKKPKYRSKVLNDNKNFYDDLVVLQTKREINNTPSNYSERSREPDSIKWSDFLPPLVQRNDSNVTVINSGKGKEANKKRVTLIENTEPVTLLGSETKKDEKNLYNFFVDLLETTLNVYNVNTEINKQQVNIKPSKIKIETDLNVKNLKIDDVKANNNLNKINCNWKNTCCGRRNVDNNGECSECITTKRFNYCVQDRVTNVNKAKHKIKSQSFGYKKKNPIPFTHSLTRKPSSTTSKKPIRDPKRNFLNTLKEELQRNDTIYEEPQSFYQALKVMARNKKKYQKSVMFYGSAGNNGENDGECEFKRRKLLSCKTTSRKKKKITVDNKPFQPNTNTLIRNTKNIRSESDFGSLHSIQVFGYDYESVNPNNSFEKHDYASSSSKSDIGTLCFRNSTITLYGI